MVKLLLFFAFSHKKILQVEIIYDCKFKLFVAMLMFLILPPDKMATISALNFSIPIIHGAYNLYELEGAGNAEMVGNLTKTYRKNICILLNIERLLGCIGKKEKEPMNCLLARNAKKI